MKRYEKENGALRPDDVESIVRETVAEQALEGMRMTEEEISKLRDYVGGKISSAAYMEWAVAHAVRDML